MSPLFALVVYTITLLIVAERTAGRPSRLQGLRRNLQPRGTPWTMSKEYVGEAFFGWNYYDQADPTNGLVNYLKLDDAKQKGLVSVVNGVFEMTVDDTSTLKAGGKRDSVRITSPDAFNIGLLYVADIQYMPWGCGLWPAWWSVGPQWPAGGEIDLLEGVNDAKVNQITVHTSPGCTLTTIGSLKPGVNKGGTDCASGGCAYQDTDPKSYGEAFNSNGGGVYAHIWDTTGVTAWFIPRDKVTGDITNKTPDPSAWGPPTASFSSSSCSMDHFHDHNLVFDTTLCGDWAGSRYTADGCPGSCADRVLDPANFKTAKWGINSVRVYHQ